MVVASSFLDYLGIMAKPRFLNLFVLLATAVYCVVASPTGAPSSVCDSMVPGHSVLEQTGASPYVIELSTTKYCPNRTVSVTLKGSTDSETFKGFLCQARTAVDTYVTSGQLTSADTKASKNNCVGKATLTHGNRDVKNSFYMTWTPDATGTGDIYIVCTIVKEKTTFWVKQSTRAITYAGMDACSTDGKETEKPGTCPTPTGAGKCLEACSDDRNCTGNQKCCSNGCGHTCQIPVPDEKPGTCPTPTGVGGCVEDCSSDSSCTGKQKCCSNGCGHSCQMPEGDPMNVCTTGNPLQDPANCGRGGEPCPASHYCEISPTDSYAVCCPKDLSCTSDDDCMGTTNTTCIGGRCTISGAVESTTTSLGVLFASFCVLIQFWTI